MGADRRGETSGRFVERLVPCEPLATAAFGAAPLRVLQTIGEVAGLGQGCTLAAQTSAIGRMVGIAPNASDRPIFRRDENATADAAVTTGGLDFALHDHPSA